MSDIQKPLISNVMSAKELLELDVDDVPMLVEGLIQKTGLVGITGSSDVGKSCFLRQLALSIVGGDKKFLGFPLNRNTGSVIYVSTEDMMTDLAYLVKKQLKNPSPIDDCWNNLYFVTDTDSIFSRLDVMMEKIKPDCVIIDAFTDIFTGDFNMATAVRAPLNNFKNLAQKHESVFIVLNHVGKRTEKSTPSKHNSLGSQGFEAKMRMLAEIRLDSYDRDKRHLCIVKGNYIPNEEKERSFVIRMDTETLLFELTGERTDFSELGSSKSSLKDEWKPRCCELKEQSPDKTVNEIFEMLQNEGFEGSRSTVGNYLRDCN